MGIDETPLVKPLTITSWPTRGPFAEGVKVIFTVQDPFAGRGDEEMQTPVSEKSPVAFRPMTRTFPIAILVRVRRYGTLEVPAFWLPKERE
jgi:hypothetical protein